MWVLFIKDMQYDDPSLLSPLTLAFFGDSVYELFVRRELLNEGSRPAGELHRKAVEMVRASAQAAVYDNLLAVITEEEEAILKRGRNANSTHIPKSSSPAQYRKATGVEALFGWLFLSGRTDRAEELFKIATAPDRKSVV